MNVLSTKYMTALSTRTSKHLSGQTPNLSYPNVQIKHIISAMHVGILRSTDRLQPPTALCPPCQSSLSFELQLCFLFITDSESAHYPVSVGQPLFTTVLFQFRERSTLITGVAAHKDLTIMGLILDLLACCWDFSRAAIGITSDRARAEKR